MPRTAIALCLFLVSTTALFSQDEAVRAFLGIRATRIDLVAPAKDRYYVSTFAKFEKGQFMGYGSFLGTGINLPQSTRRYIEVAWGKNAGVEGFVFVEPMGQSSFNPDPFFEYLTVTSTGSYPPKCPQFNGFDVIGYGLSKNVPRLFGASDVAQALQDCDYAIAILYREFETQAEYLQFVTEFKKAKTP